MDMDKIDANYREKSLQNMEALIPAFDIDLGDSSLTGPVRQAMRTLWRRVVPYGTWKSCNNLTDFNELKRLYIISKAIVNSYINHTGGKPWWQRQQRECGSSLNWVAGCTDEVRVEVLPKSKTESKYVIEGMCKGIVSIADSQCILVQENLDTISCLPLKNHSIMSIIIDYIDPNKDCDMYNYTHATTDQLKAIDYLGHSIERMINGVKPKRIKVLPEFKMDVFEGILKLPTDWSTKNTPLILTLVKSDGSCDGCMYNGDLEGCKARVDHCKSGEYIFT